MWLPDVTPNRTICVRPMQATTAMSADHAGKRLGILVLWQAVASRGNQRNWSSMTGYMIGPDVTMQLVDDEAVIRSDIDPGSGAFPPAACFRSSASRALVILGC